MRFYKDLSGDEFYRLLMRLSRRSVLELFPHWAEDVQGQCFGGAGLGLILHVAWDDVHVAGFQEFDLAADLHLQLALDDDASSTEHGPVVTEISPKACVNAGWEQMSRSIR